MSIAIKIREFFEELFKSSIVETLKDEILMIRQDFERRIQDKDAHLSDYKTELEMARVKLAQYEMALFPFSFSSKLPPPKLTSELHGSSTSSNSWVKQQEEWGKQQEDEAEAEKQNQGVTPNA